MKRPAVIDPARAVLIAWTVLLCALAIPLTAHARDASSLLKQARQYIVLERYREAREAAMTVLFQEPDNREAILLLAIALGRRGSHKEAASLLKRALYMDPLDAEVNLELGRNFLDRGIPMEAADFFERALELSDDSAGDIALEAARYLRRLKAARKAAGDKKLSATALIGVQHDTNVPAISEDLIPPGRKEDFRATLKLALGYQGYETKSARASAQYSFYHSAHDTLSGYDTDVHSLTLKGMARRNGAALEVRYIFEHAIIDGFTHSTTHAISPSLVLPAGETGSAIVTYRYRDTGARDVPVSPSNSGRSGHSHLVGLTGVKTFNKAARARISLLYEDRDTRLPEYEYEGRMLNTGASLDLSEKTGTSVYASAEARQYAGPGSGRDEHRFMVSASVGHELSRPLGLVLSVSYIWNNSDMDAYEYERAQTSLLMKARY